MATSFKGIVTVPEASDLVDTCLSRTQRQLPTQIHKNFKITRIRHFYARKIKYTEQNFCEKFEMMLTQFPRLQDIHPFHADLFNILYDRDHFKIALAQISTAKHLIEGVGRDYVRLMKFGDSLYRCKQLKRAALGRMVTIVLKQKEPLAYLEQVRQHIARLPAIDPNTRTLLICGYPNVGKSSFMNKITRAEVDVQPYAFTTKSLYIGHFDYKYLRWQAIDTPGILDHPLEDMNTIEMQSITALAHLRACVLYFMDLSEHCGFSVEEQVKLFHSIKPLFANKVTILVINKIDIARIEDLSEEKQQMIKSITESGEVPMIQLSCQAEIGIMDVKNFACEKLLASRVETKLKSAKLDSVLNKIRLAQPVPRDQVPRLPYIPSGVAQNKLYDWKDPERRKLEKDLEVEAGGAGRYSIDLRKHHLLDDESWKYDAVPEILDGKNVTDYIDPNLMRKLEALEKEEELLEAEGFYDSDEEILDENEDEIFAEAADITTRKQMEKALSWRKRAALKHNPAIPRVARPKTLSQLEAGLIKAGLNPVKVTNRAMEDLERGRTVEPRGRKLSGRETLMREGSRASSVVAASNRGMSTSRPPREESRARSASRHPRDDSVTNPRIQSQIDKMKKNINFRQRKKYVSSKLVNPESDRMISQRLIKHLNSGIFVC